MFNLKGSEIVFLLLIALVVLGPEKLPDAVRKFGRLYGEFRKIANGFQGELRSALDEPMREIRGTADALRQAAQLNVPLTTPLPGLSPDPAPTASPSAVEPRRELGLDFGAATLRRRETSDAVSPDDAPVDVAPADDAPADDAPADVAPTGSVDVTEPSTNAGEQL